MNPRALVPRRIAALFLAFLLLSTGAIHGASPSPATGSPVASTTLPCRTLLTGPQILAMPLEGVERQVLVVVPPSADETGPMPLVLAFHAHGAHAGQLASTSGLSNAALADGFVVAYPQGTGEPSDWHFPGAPYEPIGSMGDIALAEALLDHLAAEGCIDMGRVVLVGHSKGGGLADAVACHLADRVIGVVLAAAIQFGIPCQPSRPLPIVAFHAVNDPILPYEGGPVRGAPRAYPEVIGVEEAMSAWATRDGCTGGPVTTELPDGGAVLTWNGCLAPVVLQRLARGGHRYPAMATQVVRDMIRGSAPGGAPGG